ncbi:MAG: DUF2760 domain-containing protein [Akkermansiaceae bacterium]
MNHLAKIAAVLLILLSAALLVPEASAYSQEIAIASLVVAILLITALLAGGGHAPHAPKLVAAQAIKPVALAPLPKNHAQAEVITLLGLFQDKGRLVDFLMDDIAPYSDEQVGSVVRAVHQGCKTALQEHFTIEPVAAEAEGAVITVPAGYAADEFRLVGNLAGEAPFKGTLVHKGWKVNSVKLPRVLSADENRLPTIAPAEVEVA